MNKSPHFYKDLNVHPFSTSPTPPKTPGSNYFPHPHTPVETSIMRKRALSMTSNTPDLSYILPRANHKSDSEDDHNSIYVEPSPNFESERTSQSSLRFGGKKICKNEDCPFTEIKIHFEELKNEYNDKIKEVRSLTKKVTILEKEGSKENKGGKKGEGQFKHRAEVLELANKKLKNDLEYSRVIIKKQEIELTKKKELLKMTSWTDAQIMYMEKTKKVDGGFKETVVDKNETNKLKRRIVELERMNTDLKINNAKMFQEMENRLKGDIYKLKNENLNVNIKQTSGRKEERLVVEINRLNSVIEELEGKFKFTVEDNDKLKTAYENLIKENEKMELQRKNTERDITTIKKNYDSSTVDLINANETIQILKSELNSLSKEKKENEEKLVFLNDTFNDLYSTYTTNSSNNSYPQKMKSETTKDRVNFLKKTLQEKLKNTSKNLFENSFETPNKDKEGLGLENRFYHFWSEIIKKSKINKPSFESEAEALYTEIQQKNNQIDVLTTEFEKLQNDYMFNKENERATNKILISIIELLEGEDGRNKMFTSFSPNTNANSHTLASRINQLFIHFYKQSRRATNSTEKENKQKSSSSTDKRQIESHQETSDNMKDILSKDNNSCELNAQKRESEFLKFGKPLSRNVKSNSLNPTNSISLKYYSLLHEYTELKIKWEKLNQRTHSKDQLEELKAEIGKSKRENSQMKNLITDLEEENTLLKNYIRDSKNSEITEFSEETTKLEDPNDSYREEERSNYERGYNEEAEHRSIDSRQEQELYYEFENENELHSFMEDLIRANRERVEELETIITTLKENLDKENQKNEDLEIENKKLKIENDSIDKLKESLEYYKIRIKGYEIANRQSGVESNNSRSQTDKEEFRKSELSENELLHIENNKLSTNIYKLANKIKMLKTSTEDIGGGMEVEDDESREIQLDLSDLNPNKNIETTKNLEIGLKENIEIYKSQLDQLFYLNERLTNENKKLEENLNVFSDKRMKIFQKSYDDIIKENEFLVKERNAMLLQVHRESTKMNSKIEEIGEKTFKLSMCSIQNALLKAEIERLLIN